MDGRLRVLNLDDKVVQHTIDPGPVEAWTVLPSQKSMIATVLSQVILAPRPP
jgi:hypothetical protein